MGGLSGFNQWKNESMDSESAEKMGVTLEQVTPIHMSRDNSNQFLQGSTFGKDDMSSAYDQGPSRVAKGKSKISTISIKERLPIQQNVGPVVPVPVHHL